jgi:hypothetical protein
MTPKTLCFPGDTVLASKERKKERKKERNIVYFLNNSILIYSQDSTIALDTSTADLQFEGSEIYSRAEFRGTARIGL